MAKLTREQLQKINNSCDNGFKLDLNYFFIHGEKALVKNVNIDEKQYLKAFINFCDELEEVTQGNGIKYRKSTGRKIPYIRVSLYHRGEHADSSYGLGKMIYLGNGVARKSLSLLQKSTKKVTDELIKNLYENNIELLNNSIIIG